MTSVVVNILIRDFKPDNRIYHNVIYRLMFMNLVRVEARLESNGDRKIRINIETKALRVGTLWKALSRFCLTSAEISARNVSSCCHLCPSVAQATLNPGRAAKQRLLWVIPRQWISQTRLMSVAWSSSNRSVRHISLSQHSFPTSISVIGWSGAALSSDFYLPILIHGYEYLKSTWAHLALSRNWLDE